MFLLKDLIIILLFIITLALYNSKNDKKKIIGLVMMILTLSLYVYLKYDTVIVFNPIFIFIYIAIIFGIFLLIYKKYRNLKYEKESYKDINYLNRDISTDYPPSIVGYLLNQKLRYKDLIADILELYAKKIINISKNKEQENKKINFYVELEDYKNKVNDESQLYIINTLINNRENAKFDFRTWKRLVLEEYKKRKFSSEKNYYNSKIIITIFICLTIIGGIIGWISGIKYQQSVNTMILGMIGGAFVGIIVGYQFINFIKNSENTNVFLSSYGKNELKKWIKFKKFIKDYTLLKERTINEIEIYESYIPYAITLDVNVQYKNTKFDIFDENEIQSIINESDSANFLKSMGINIE